MSRVDKFDRIQQLHRIFKSRRLPVSVRALAEELECSERNVKRLLESMQLVDAPLQYDKKQRGWHYVEDPHNLFELPGLWLTGDELQSLSLLLNLLEQLGNGILNDEIAVIEGEIANLLRARDIDPSAFTDRIRVLPMAQRQLQGKVFNRVTEALLQQKRLHIYYSDYRGNNSDRYVSPQHLIYYRENWYLDAFCHLRNNLRTFSVARIIRADILMENGKQIDSKTLREHFSSAFGIFAGKPHDHARLRFYPAVAREIANQQWHPNQQGEWDGRDYLLTIPYANDKELLQDILRHLPHVVVEVPVELREAVQQKLRQALAVYGV